MRILRTTLAIATLLTLGGCGGGSDTTPSNSGDTAAKPSRSDISLRRAEIFAAATQRSLESATFSTGNVPYTADKPAPSTTVTPTSSDAQPLAVTDIGTFARPQVLVLYEAPTGQAYAKFGLIHGILMRNLLGHFDVDVKLQAINTYAAGTVNNYDATFYLGSFYDYALPAAFVSDVAATNKTVVWAGYNIWKLAWDANAGFTNRYGLAFDGLRGFNTPPSSSNPAPGFFDTVSYKGKNFVKFYKFDSATGAIFADPDAGAMRVVDSAKASAVVDIKNSATGETIPYVARSGNFWYVADHPLAYMGPRDRYLVFADLLHDILGINHTESHRAMVRLEDMDALLDPQWIRNLADYFNSKQIPFSMGVIPLYLDPFGVYNGNVPQEVRLSQDPDLLSAITYAQQRGGAVLMHGYTHQYNNVRNPYSAVSGDDWEFWNFNTNSPVSEDSKKWALDRLDAGLAEMRANGLAPFTWETPHYQGSANMHSAVADRFASRYERSFYYTAVSPQLNLGAEDPARDFAAGQFFPYIIQKDYYNQRVLPENLGNPEYTPPIYTWQDIVTNAEYALVVRDGFASFFYHAYLLDSVAFPTGFDDLKTMVDAINGLGYTWVGANSL